jgi:putative DNA primase/helicase
MKMLEAALAYAHRNWPVFPCHPGTKAPLVGQNRDPLTGAKIKGSGGLRKATCDEATIRAWWSKWPKAMIGVPMGPQVNAFVLDLDLGDPPLISGKDYLERFVAHVGGMPHTAIVETASGGLHLYFAWDPASPVDNNGKRLVPALTIAPSPDAKANDGGKAKGAGIDGRGAGGYVIVPPSVRADGRAYTWAQPLEDGIAAPTPRIWDVALKRELREIESPPLVPAQQTQPTVSQRASANPRGENGVHKYVLAALESEARKLAGVAPGERNNSINTTAFVLGRLVGAGELNDSVVRAMLQDIVSPWPNFTKSCATIESGLQAGIAEPRDLSDVRARASRQRRTASRSPQANGPPSHQSPEAATRGGGHEGGGDGEAGERELDRRLAGFALTDLGNVERFVERFGHQFKWCAVIGWLAWDGKRWSPDRAEGLVNLAVHETVRAIKREADALAGTDDDYEIKTRTGTTMRSAQIMGWHLTSQGSRHFGCITGPKGAPAYLEISVSALDADPMKINVANGTLVVRKTDDGSPYVTLKPHDPADLITKLAPVDYDPAAACPVYDRFLEEVQPQTPMRRFLHQWGGLSLTGDISEQALALFIGTGKNGKSTLVEAWAHLAGEYSKSCPIETFLDPKRARRGGEPTPDLAMLAGVRFLRASEPEHGAKLAEALIKLVTGGDAMAVRHLNRDFFELRPQFKLTMFGNHRPTIRGRDEGIWRRVVLVPWTVIVAEDRRDPHLKDKLAAEASGILNRLLDGLRDWLDHRLVRPDEVKVATAQYRSDSDPLGRFLGVAVRRAPGGRVQSTELYRVFCAWAKVNGVNEWSMKGFADAMTDAGYDKKQSNVMWWLDIELVRRVGDFEDGGAA